jgi:hypothetical protein
MSIEFPRIFPIRKPEGFVPAVQRWSAVFPPECSAIYVNFFGVQGPSDEAIAESGFEQWAARAMAGEGAPVAFDRSRFVDEAGLLNLVVTAYWIDPASLLRWRTHHDGWWVDSERLAGSCGFWRELLTAPVERVETIYWKDYPAALAKALPMTPTAYAGYFGAMRDRIPLAACDTLATVGSTSLSSYRAERSGAGKRWRVIAPHNLAVIRSASFWGRCDDEQLEDYEQKLRDPLTRGMDFLRGNPEESGCASLRFQRTLSESGDLVPETHAHGYFLNLEKMEQWSEGHASHKAIFGAAIARYKKYGPINQLRTWHEVLVLPGHGQQFDYINCHEGTGLLSWFDAVEW